MNVLILNYEYPPLGGGAANATFHIIQQFAGVQGHAVTLVTSSTGAFRIENISENVTVHFLDIGKRGSLHYQTNRELLRYSRQALRNARKLCREQSFDVVHAFFGIPCGVIARKLGLPYIVSLRGSDVPGYSPRFKLLETLFFRRMSRRVWQDARAVVANSEGLRELALGTSPGQEIAVIPNGVNTDIFHPSSGADEPVEGPERVLRVLFVGRLIERKGVYLLLRALCGMAGIEITIVGDGPERDSLSSYALQEGVRAQFLGNQDASALPDIYREHDLFVLPSRNEGMSNTVLEAMASGLPVIVTDVGGTRELVSENGTVIPIDDETALRAAVLDLRDDESRRAEMGRRSRGIALEYSWERVATAYLKLYNTPESVQT